MQSQRAFLSLYTNGSFDGGISMQRSMFFLARFRAPPDLRPTNSLPRWRPCGTPLYRYHLRPSARPLDRIETANQVWREMKPRRILPARQHNDRCRAMLPRLANRSSERTRLLREPASTRDIDDPEHLIGARWRTVIHRQLETTVNRRAR